MLLAVDDKHLVNDPDDLTSISQAAVRQRPHASSVAAAIHADVPALREQLAKLEARVLERLRRVRARAAIDHDAHQILRSSPSRGKKSGGF